MDTNRNSPSEDAPILVRSHVARDLLQSAALFKTDRLVLWEYISNGLQYVEAGVSPQIRVKIDKKNKRATIQDNGRGMDWAGLENFFVMHGENVDRKAGRGGRGRFGTGKSAAFGIADTLRVTTIQDGKRSQVELSRRDITAMQSAEGIPVRTLQREQKTSAPNGTLIEIENIHLRALDQGGIIAYVERHLARWPKGASVSINHHQCEWAEPIVQNEYSLPAEGRFRDALGEVILTVKVAKAPLDEELRGVAIFSRGVWQETTLAGSEGREMAQYIFGELDVPRLEEDTSPISPFDMSRSLRLNPENALVQMIYAFISHNVENVRRELAAVERERKAGEEAKKLDRQAQEIAQLINEDFEDFRHRVAKARAKLVQTEKAAGAAIENDDLVFGAQERAEIIAPTGGVGHENGGGQSRGNGDPRELNPLVEAGDSDAALQGRPAGGSTSLRKSGFAVRFRDMGEAAHRAEYKSDERTIYINLDHPQIRAAQKAGERDDIAFKRLAYEVAFSEYAIALSSELAGRDEFYDASEAIVELREILNRVARKGAALYAA